MTFVLSKLFWFLAAPGNLLVLVLCGSTLLLFTRRPRLARWPIGLVVVAMVVIATVPIGQWLLVPLENRFPSAAIPTPLDGIIVLGGGISPDLLEARGQADLNEHADRLFALASLARRFPEATVIFTGGSASLVPGREREADAAFWLVTELGLDPGRIVFERKSRNTFENALYSKALVTPEADERWLLVTSAFHMPRAVGVFRAQDWPVLAYPVDYQTDGQFHLLRPPDFTAGLAQLSRGVREWVGLVAYRWLGYTDSLFPAPRP